MARKGARARRHRGDDGIMEKGERVGTRLLHRGCCSPNEGSASLDRSRPLLLAPAMLLVAALGVRCSNDGGSDTSTDVQSDVATDRVAIDSAEETGDEPDGVAIDMDGPDLEAGDADVGDADADSPWTGTAYYVAPDGNDDRPGTIEEPFRTIQHAADIMGPGDACLIREGTYYEVVRPANSGTADDPITFMAYEDEDVVVFGGRAVTEWVNEGGSHWRATVPETVMEVFVDRRYMLWARYPNVPFDPETGYSLLPLEREDWSDPPSGIDWETAVWWRTDSNVWVAIIDRDGPPTGEPWHTILFDDIRLLDVEGEWLQAGGQLHLLVPGGANPNTLRIEVKTMGYAVDFSEREHIHLRDVTVWGGSINMDGAEHCVVDGIRNYYPSALVIGSSGWRGLGSVPIHFGTPGTGLTVGGRFNTVSNSEIAHGWCDGISLYGESNTVEGCHIYDLGWSGTDCAAITMGGRGHSVRRNHLHRTGRSVLLHRTTQASIIEHNEIHDGGLMMLDLGATYTYQTDGEGTEIVHNLIYDIPGEGALWWRNGAHTGIYLDEGSSNFVVHHNVIYNVGTGVYTNMPAVNHQIVNNTIWACEFAMSASVGSGGITNQRVFNNLFPEGAGPLHGTEMGGNLEAADPLFVDLEGCDFHLTAESPAVDHGVHLPGFTDGYCGEAPDTGAFEYVPD
ncbi:MAG: right-handed parallel beta-helix repeat-containing protein [Pseudomonadota bacterium]